MEMVSLVPKVWEDRSQRPAEGDEMAKERERVKVYLWLVACSFLLFSPFQIVFL
jgi:hypothetical protein